MEILFPHRVEYKFNGPVSIPEVIGTLDATQHLAAELGHLLEAIVDGLVIERIAVQVSDIEEGSLKEYFILAIAMTFQDDLKKTVPPMVSKLLGVQIPDEYNTLVTACVVLLLFIGAELVTKRLGSTVKTFRLKEQSDLLIAELSRETNTPESRIRKALDDRFSKPSRARKLGRAAVQFFRPSRMRKNDPVLVGDKLIESDVVAEVPKEDAGPEELEPTQSLTGVRIEINAKDKDKGNVGWAGTIKNVSDRRLKMVLFPTVRREDLWNRDEVKGDVIVHFRPDGDPDGDGVSPYMFHILNVYPES